MYVCILGLWVSLRVLVCRVVLCVCVVYIAAEGKRLVFRDV